MIRIGKDYTDIPESLSNDKFKKHLEKYNKKEVNVSGNYYGAEDVRDKLKEIYHNKCGYCEKIVYKPEIEHYRPKNTKKYRYLAYEWSNLFPACHSCNHSKLDEFPVENNIELDLDIYDAIRLNQIEKPLIIHPEVDRVEDYFDFNIKTGEILTKHGDEKASKTIKVCNLNSGDLVYFRKKVFDSIKEHINLLSLSASNSGEICRPALKNVLKKLKKSISAENEYSSFKNCIWERFEDEILPLFLPAYKHTVKDCYVEININK